jgi:hypothetical protein
VKGDRPEPNKQKHKKKIMKTKLQNQNPRLQNRPEQSGTEKQPNRKASFSVMKSSKHNFVDPNQTEFGLLWRPFEFPFRLRAGDVIRFENRLCRVVRVNECAAVVLMNRPVRDFKTRFDKPVRFTPPPALFRISPDSETEILNRK